MENNVETVQDSASVEIVLPEIKLETAPKELDPIEEFQNWVNSLSDRKPSAEGCFFILNETVYPYFWNNYFFPTEVPLEEAWTTICDGWLNGIYKTVLPIQKLFPFILRGYVKDGVIFMGHDCPYYAPEIQFCFNLPKDTVIRVDKSMSIELNIPNELIYVLKSMLKDCPYFERLPKRIQFHRRDYGLDKERAAAGRSLITQSYQVYNAKIKRARLGSLPKLVPQQS
jgi:hypothetical protein